MNFDKDPSAVLDYAFDWTAWLAAGETIASALVTVDDGLTKDSQTIDAGKVVVWLSGGTTSGSSVPTHYTVACHITTSQGRQDDRSFTVTMHDR